MNWGKVLMTGAVGGVVLWLYQFVMHGLILGNTYAGMSIFIQTGSPFWFLAIAVTTGIGGAMMFSKTRNVWGAGIKGGVTFGAILGIVPFFGQFYFPMLIDGFPYYLAWCWGTIAIVGWMIFGAVASFIIKES